MHNLKLTKFSFPVSISLKIRTAVCLVRLNDSQFLKRSKRLIVILIDTCTDTSSLGSTSTTIGLVKTLYGVNGHHIVESLFKGIGHALKEAVTIEGDTVLSTKGVL